MAEGGSVGGGRAAAGGVGPTLPQTLKLMSTEDWASLEAENGQSCTFNRKDGHAAVLKIVLETALVAAAKSHGECNLMEKRNFWGPEVQHMLR